MKLSSITKKMLVPLVATVSLLAGMCLVAAPAGATTGNEIVGTITDATTGLPIAGLCVEVAPSAGGASFDQTTTSSTGAYALDGVPNGSYAVNAACGTATDSTDSNIYAQQESPTLTMTTGSTLEQNMSMNYGGTIGGTVYSASGDPVSGVCVDANPVSPSASEPSLGIPTNSLGEYTLSGLATAPYTLTVWGSSSAGPCSVNSDTTSVTIVANQDLTQNFSPTSTPPTTGTISGTITDESDNPLSGICVEVTSPSGGDPLYSTTSGSDGSFTVLNVAPGEYSLNTNSGCGSASIYATTFTTGIDVSAGATTAASVEMGPGGDISGTVSSTSGSPISNACVSATPSSGTSFGGSTTSTGSYDLSGLPVGEYTVRVDPTCAGTVSSTYGSESSTQEVTVNSTTVDNVTLTSSSPSAPTAPSSPSSPSTPPATTPTTDTVSFNSEGGSAVAAMTGTDGSTITLPAAPHFFGFVFDGWFTAAAGGTQVTSPYTLTGSITLYAQWTANAVTTTPPITKPRVIDALRVVGVAHVGKASTVRVVGVSFVGSPKKIVSNAPDTTVRFVRDPKSYLLVRISAGAKSAGVHTITVVLHSGKKELGKYTTEAAVRKTSTTPPLTTTTTPPVSPPTSTTTPPATTTTPPASTPTTSTVSFDSDGGSAVASESAADGSTITLPAAPIYSGFNFDGWFTSASGGSEVQSPYTVTGATTLYAQWTVASAPFQGSYSANWSGYVLPVSDNSVTAVSASWTVPTLNCSATPNGTTAMWVGLNGAVGADPLIQTGVGSFCSPDGSQTIQAWWEVVPAANYSEVFSQLDVSAGDQMSAAVFLNADGQWETQLEDLTTGLEGTTLFGGNWYVSNIATGAIVAVDGTAAPYLYAGVTTADFVVEAPSSDSSIDALGDFGTVSFTSLEVNGSAPTLTPQDAFDMFSPSGSVLTAESPVANDAFSESYIGPSQSSSAEEKGSAS